MTNVESQQQQYAALMRAFDQLARTGWAAERALRAFGAAIASVMTPAQRRAYAKRLIRDEVAERRLLK